MKSNVININDVERTGRTLMRDGKYKGKMFKDIPRGYIEFLMDRQGHLSRPFQELIEYHEMQKYVDEIVNAPVVYHGKLLTD